MPAPGKKFSGLEAFLVLLLKCGSIRFVTALCQWHYSGLWFNQNELCIKDARRPCSCIKSSLPTELITVFLMMPPGPFYNQPQTPTKYVPRSSTDGMGHLDHHSRGESTVERQTAMTRIPPQRASDLPMTGPFFDEQHRKWMVARMFLPSCLVVLSCLMVKSNKNLITLRVGPDATQTVHL